MKADALFPNAENSLQEYVDSLDNGSYLSPNLPFLNVLDTRIKEVSNLFSQKISIGFAFNDPGGNPQVFEYSDSGLKWLDRAALRARKSIDNVENKTFKMRVTGGSVVLTDTELLNNASDFYDSGTDIDDIYQDHKDALRDIATGVGTDDEKRAALIAYDIETGW